MALGWPIAMKPGPDGGMSGFPPVGDSCSQEGVQDQGQGRAESTSDRGAACAKALRPEGCGYFQALSEVS